MNDLTHSDQRRLSRWHIQLSTLLLLVTIFAILTAWFVDQRTLRAQIKRRKAKRCSSIGLRTHHQIV